MSIAEPKTTYTVEDLLAMPDGEYFELVDGQLVELNMGTLAGRVANRVGARLDDHCYKHDLGEVFNAETIYRCFPYSIRTARRPDVSFIRKQRLPTDWPELGYFTIPPDLAVEVMSENDLALDVLAKIEEYLRAGVALVWLVDAQQRKVFVHRLDGTVTKLGEGDALSGEDVVPGFQCPVSELFPPKSP